MKFDFESIPDRSRDGAAKWVCEGSSTEFVPLSVADMEFYTAQPIRDAISAVAQEKVLGYTDATDEYYRAVCSWMKRRHDFEIEKDWIVCTPGVIDALGMLVEAVTDPGDGVIIMSPVYYPFDVAVTAKMRNIIYCPLINNDGYYEIDFENFEKIAARTDAKALLFCNPHNPVGRVWTKEELTRVADICCDNGVFIIDDEIHNDLIMPGVKHTVTATVTERVKKNIAVCTAPSKTFNLAGLQCSNIIIPDADNRAKMLVSWQRALHWHLNIFAFAACTAAYNECEPWLDELLGVIKGNADYVKEFMAENFPEIKVSNLEGTYLQWLDMRGLGMTHLELKAMLDKAMIFTDYGEMFGPAGRGFQRINLACARVSLEKAMQRFKAAVEEVRADWAANGKPRHRTLRPGDRIAPFSYKTADGTKEFKGNTLLVFAGLTFDFANRALFSYLEKAAAELAERDYTVTLVTASGSEKTKDLPDGVDVIHDKDGVLFNLYNVFEADSATGMIAGDKIYEQLQDEMFRTLKNSELFRYLFAPDTVKEKAARPLQTPAFFTVDEKLTVREAHYGKTICDFAPFGY